MNLVFEQTPPWPLKAVDPRATALKPPGEIELYVTPILILTDWDPWIRSALSWGVSSDARLDVVSDKAQLSSVEWPVRVIESTLSVDNRVVEARIYVLYLLLEWNATVILRSPPEQMAEARERALGFMLSGRPNWTGADVVSLAELYAEARIDG
jgi:hypothetical protein